MLVIYFAQVSDGIIDILNNLSVMFMVAIPLRVIGTSMLMHDSTLEEDISSVLKKTFNWSKKLLIAAGISMIISVVIPSSKTIYLMTGVSATEELIESPRVKKVMQIIDLEIDKLLKDN